MGAVNRKFTYKRVKFVMGFFRIYEYYYSIPTQIRYRETEFIEPVTDSLAFITIT
jgi:hypothetical protein